MSEWKSERREFPRKDMGCLVTVDSGDGEQRARGRMMNICDGGAMFSVPVASLAALPTNVDLSISLPRRTANTRMVEQVLAGATIVRQEPMADETRAGVAVRFAIPLDLQLDL